MTHYTSPEKAGSLCSAKMIRSSYQDLADRNEFFVRFWAPSGHPDRRLVCISLIFLCIAWSKLDVQIVVAIQFGDPFKAWVEGSSPSALTKLTL
jgi:hypothetical protein